MRLCAIGGIRKIFIDFIDMAIANNQAIIPLLMSDLVDHILCIDLSVWAISKRPRILKLTHAN